MTNSVNLYIIVENEGVLQIKQDAFFLIIKVISGRYNRERLCKNAAPKVTAKTLRQKDRILTMLRKERHYAVRRRCNSLSPTGLKGNLSGYTTEAQNSHQGEVCAFLSVQKITRIFVSKTLPNQKIIYQNRRKFYELSLIHI